MPEILIATDAGSVFDTVNSVVAAPGTAVRWIRAGAGVRASVSEASVGLAIVDGQIGAMGGIAVALDLRLEADAGRLDPTPVLLLLDRRADVFLARRSGVEGWLLKPLDPIRIRRAAAALLGGGTWYDESYLPRPVVVPFGSDSVSGTGK